MTTAARIVLRAGAFISASICAANAPAVASDSSGDASSAAAVAVPQSGQIRYEARERYRFNLGGPSGEFTDWERYDLSSFGGLATTVKIDKVHGKPGDKWSAMGRISLVGAGEKSQRQRISLVLYADRSNSRITPLIELPGEKAAQKFDAQFEVGKPIVLSIVPGSSGKLVYSLDGHTYVVPCNFEIKSISIVGSGVDISFDAFSLMRRVAN